MAWLVNQLAAYDIELKRGKIVLPGSCLQAIPMDESGFSSCSFEGWGIIEFDVV